MYIFNMDMFPSLLSIYLEAKSLDHTLTLFMFNTLRDCCFPESLHYFSVQLEGSAFSTSSLKLVIYSYFIIAILVDLWF